MLYGRYEHTVDAKNRMFVPAKFKDELGSSFKLTYNDFNKCILVYSDMEWAKYEEKIPMGRLGTPEDMATTAVYLAADASSYVTGQMIYVDGGWLVN